MAKITNIPRDPNLVGQPATGSLAGTSAATQQPFNVSGISAVPPPVPEPERRHTPAIWVYILGALIFLAGVYLLAIEDQSATRRTILAPQNGQIAPRTDLPSRPSNTFGSLPSSLPTGFDTRTETAASATTTVRPAADAGVRSLSPAFLDSLWRDAEAAGVRRPTFDRAMADVRALEPDVLAKHANQPELDRTIGDYVGMIVNTERISNGKGRAEQNVAILQDIERRYGVDRHILLAIWGIESNFGAAKGDRSVIRSLSTLAAAETRRSAFWKGELVAALTILEQEKLAPEKLVGSWAGAMGHTQFMPSTYLKHAVDYDGDGVRDVWSSVPDALASTARYLQASGWQPGRSWGREVVLPGDFDFSLASPSTPRSISAWRVLGLRAMTGTLPNDDQALWQLVVPAGAGGPAFLVSPNFEALLAYNRAYSYAIAVGALADRIAGSTPIQAQWPVGDTALSRDQRLELQEILQSMGHDVGGVDGIVGSKTRDAIRAFQKLRGIPADGHPSVALLARIRTERRL